MVDDITLTGVLIECVKAAGGSKVIGALLWPDLPVDHAQRKLLDTLNDDRPHRLTPDQALLVASRARDAGCHAYAEYVCRRLHYQQPVPREPQQEMADLQRAFVASVAEQHKLLAQLQALTGALGVPVAGLKAVA